LGVKFQIILRFYAVFARLHLQVLYLLSGQPMKTTSTKTNGKKLALCAAITAVTFTLLGCKHTANGAGKDIEKMGEKIQEKTE